MNALLPLTLLGGAAVATLVIGQAIGAAAPQRVGLMLVASMLLLALLEHLLMVLPFSSTALWRWAMRHAPASASSATP
jgi:putative photosynthetic complex assembly protein 2